ncbi:MAG: DUF177 domain-containing protein [Rhizobiaceae bacterium]
MNTKLDEVAPFEFAANIRTLSKKGQHVKYSAPEDAREAIATTYELVSVESFEAKALLAPWKRDGVQVTGHIKANITQPCAISSEPLTAVVDETVEMFFVPDGSKLAKPRTNEEGEWVFDVEGNELPETFVGDSIDVAAVWLEYFSLGIDLFARKNGAAFEPVEDGVEGGDKPDSPFAALAGLKKP